MNREDFLDVTPRNHDKLWGTHRSPQCHSIVPLTAVLGPRDYVLKPSKESARHRDGRLEQLSLSQEAIHTKSTCSMPHASGTC